jgi:hypothetical protein
VGNPFGDLGSLSGFRIALLTFCIIYTHPVRAGQETHYASATEPNRSMPLFIVRGRIPSSGMSKQPVHTEFCKSLTLHSTPPCCRLPIPQATRRICSRRRYYTHPPLSRPPPPACLVAVLTRYREATARLASLRVCFLVLCVIRRALLQGAAKCPQGSVSCLDTCPGHKPNSVSPHAGEVRKMSRSEISTHKTLQLQAEGSHKTWIRK